MAAIPEVATVDQATALINNAMNELDQKWVAIRDQKRELAKKRAALMLERECIIWGLTEEEYRECKDRVEQPRRLRSAHEGLVRRAKRLREKVGNSKFTEAARKKFADELQHVQAKILTSAEKLVDAQNTPTVPLAQLLNEKRVAKGLPPRQVQSVSARV